MRATEFDAVYLPSQPHFHPISSKTISTPNVSLQYDNLTVVLPALLIFHDLAVDLSFAAVIANLLYSINFLSPPLHIHFHFHIFFFFFC